MEKLLNTLFPPKCLFCNKNNGSAFCINCLEKCQVLEKSSYIIYRKDTDRNITHINVFSPFEYDGLVRTCIKVSKYGSKQFAALKVLCELGLEYSIRLKKEYKECTVIPIPLNKRKYRSRGFNQAELIAEMVKNKYKLTIDKNLLVRSRETTEQYKENREQRMENVRGAFSVKETPNKYKKILLVDDICTTGATLGEAARILRENGYVNIEAFTLSRRS